jgi:hypothetical protein
MKLTYFELDYERIHYQKLRGAAWEEFHNRLVASWLYHDHALEGVVLKEGDLDRALRGFPTRSWCETARHLSLTRMRALIYGLLEAGPQPVDPTLDEYRRIHTSLCDTNDPTAGRYRKRDTSPGVYNLDVAPANSISYYLRRSLEQMQVELENCHPVKAAAIAHWEYMRVFPFDGRSGVVGRLMMNSMLLSRGYPPAIIHAHDRHHYFSALQGHRNDLVPIIVEAMASTIEAAKTFTGADALHPQNTWASASHSEEANRAVGS